MATSASARFSAPGFVRWATGGRKPLAFRKNESIFSEGDRSECIFYIERGSVKLTVTSKQGREAIIGVFDGGDFFGEGSVGSDPPARAYSAVALNEVRVLRIERADMIRVLRNEHHFSFPFIAYLLRRNSETEARLADSLLYSSEKHVARALLTLIHEDRVPKVSQQMLAEMTGITRQRVNFLMRQFKQLGLVEYSRGWRVNNSLRRIAHNG